jgi:hypothetical protein
MHPSIHRCIHPSIHASMHPSMHPCIHASIHPCIHPCIHPSMHPSMHPSIHRCIHPSMRLSPSKLPVHAQQSFFCCASKLQRSNLEQCHPTASSVHHKGGGHSQRQEPPSREPHPSTCPPNFHQKIRPPLFSLTPPHQPFPPLLHQPPQNRLRSSPHRIPPHPTAPHPTAPHPTASHRIPPHPTASHRTAPHRTPPHPSASLPLRNHRAPAARLRCGDPGDPR